MLLPMLHSSRRVRTKEKKYNLQRPKLAQDSTEVAMAEVAVSEGTVAMVSEAAAVAELAEATVAMA